VKGTEARKLVAAGARLLDVRTPAEYAGGHIEGAILIPVQEIQSRVNELEPKDKPIVVYCASGGRSASAAHFLTLSGYKEVFDLGGIGNW
jgi:rhodanese-related sulfurtransferase